MKKQFSLLIIITCFLYLNSTAFGAQFISPADLRYAPLQIELPQAQRVVLDNGIILYLLEDHELPLVNFNAIVRTGTMYDPPGKEGLAEITAQAMRTGGTKKLASFVIDEQFDFISSSPAVTMSMEAAEISFSVLAAKLDTGLDLLSQIIREPAFEEKKMNLAKELKKEELRRLKDNPQRYAFREFSRLLYQGNERGRLATIQSIGNIERSDLISFHQNFFSPRNMMIAITGDITKEKAVSLIKKYFGNWQGTDFQITVPPPPKSNSGIFSLNKKIPQSAIIVGRLAPAKNDKDYYAFTILDFIIGSGGFLSRIFVNIRSNEGLAYSAGSFYRPRLDHGIFGAYAFTKTQSTIKALSLINAIFADVQAKSVNTEEIAWAKKSINNGYIFSFLSVEDIAWQQMKIEYDNLPDDYLVSYRNRIDNVSDEELRTAAGKYLGNTGNIVLILGDIANFEQALPDAVTIKTED